MTQHETPACELCGDPDSEFYFSDGVHLLCDSCESTARAREAARQNEGGELLTRLREVALIAAAQRESGTPIGHGQVHRALDALLAVDGEGDMPFAARALLHPPRPNLKPLPEEVC